MTPRSYTSVLFRFGCLLVGVNTCCGEISLINRNPFGLGEDAVAETTVIEKIPNLQEELEFCGSHSIGGNRKFSLLTKHDNKKHWMELSQSLGDFKLVKYNEETRALLVEFAGKFDILPLRQASRPAVRSKHIIRRTNADNAPLHKDPQDPSVPSRRRVIPRTERPPKMLPVTPEFPEKLPSPPTRV